MKKITVVDQKKLDDYFEKTPTQEIELDKIHEAIKNKSRNYDDLDLMNHLVNYLHSSLAERKSVSNNKLGKYILTVKSIFKLFNEKEEFIGSTIITKTKALEILYINNRSFIGKEGDKSLIDSLEELKKLIDINLSFKEPKKKREIEEEPEQEECIIPDIVENMGESSKDVSEYEGIIARLQSRVNDLDTQLNDFQQTIDFLIGKDEESGKTINALNQKVDKYKLNLRKAKSEIKRVEAERDRVIRDFDREKEKSTSLNRRIDDLALQIIDLNGTVERLYEENENLHLEVANLDNTLKSSNEELNKIQEWSDLITSAKTKEEMIDAFILEQLFMKKMSLNSIFNALDKTGMNVSKDEILASLKRINSYVNIKPVIGFDKKYGIVEPAIRTDAKINYPNHKKSLDVVFLADYHYDASDISFHLQEKLNSVYDYCIKNNIKSIVSLGDLIDNKNIPDELNKENFEIIKSFIKDFDKILPYDVGIKHYILGGNHDRAFLKYGIDPIEELSFEREDTIPLGYSNAYIYFGGSDVIGLHHEGIPRESIVPNHIDSGSEAVSFINKAYENAKVNPAERYLDLFGHFHKARIDFANSFAVVPSINTDRNNDGVWHLKFDLDSSGRINHIIINTLIFAKDKELKTTNEIVYQRTKK